LVRKLKDRIAELEEELSATELERDAALDRIEELEARQWVAPPINAAEHRIKNPSKSYSSRVLTAAKLFFELPKDKQAWTRQQMQVGAGVQLKVSGPHVDWLTTFWGCPPDEQKDIAEAVKIEEIRRAA
jgi:hypothetical protein